MKERTVEIETKRLILRKFNFNEIDLNALFFLFSDETVNKYLPWYPVETKEETIKFYNKHILPKYAEKKVIFLLFV